MGTEKGRWKRKETTDASSKGQQVERIRSPGLHTESLSHLVTADDLASCVVHRYTHPPCHCSDIVSTVVELYSTHVSN